MPKRIQRKRTKGWRAPPNTMSVTRPGPYGNRYRVGEDGDAAECTAKFRADLVRAIRMSELPPRSPIILFGRPVYLGPLKGKNLMCFCGLNQSCHADVWLEFANRI